MLELRDITKQFGASKILCGASLSCKAGEAVCLAGANAAGKTTLLTIATSLQKPDSGVISCDGKMGFVPQESALLADLSVYDNLMLWYSAHKCPKAEIFSGKSAETRLGLQQYAKKRVSKLSGGIKKRTAISCALIGEPRYLLMDEPFTALDTQSRNDICRLLCTLKEKGVGILFSSHDPSAIAAVADRVVTLRDGAVDSETVLAGGEEDRLAQTIRILSGA